MIKKLSMMMTLMVSTSLAGIFSVEVINNSSGKSTTQSATTAEETFNILNFDNETIKRQINYSDFDDVHAMIDFRGLAMELSYAINSSELVLNIPSIGINERFSGINRDDSVEVMKEWFKKDGIAVVEKIMKKLAEVSPVDPVAGNPNSLMGTGVSHDFSVGFMNVASKHGTAAVKPDKKYKSENAIMLAPTYSALDIDGVKSNAVYLPLSYSFTFNRNVNEKITLSLPLSYTDVEGAKSGSVYVGLSYSKPVTGSWVLTPSISYGAAGSLDLGSGIAQVASGSLTSAYTWFLGDDYVISLGNMAGYYSTVKLYSGDYAYNPGITNVVYRNGLMLGIPTYGLIDDTSVEIFAIDTRYTGTALYMEEYQEYGLAYGYDVIDLNILGGGEAYVFNKSLKFGASYLHSSKATGIKINFGFIF